MKARIVIPREMLVQVTEEEFDEADQLAKALLEGGGYAEDNYNLVLNAKVTAFEGPDELVRPLITHVMNVIHKYLNKEQNHTITSLDAPVTASAGATRGGSQEA